MSDRIESYEGKMDDGRVIKAIVTPSSINVINWNSCEDTMFIVTVYCVDTQESFTAHTVDNRLSGVNVAVESVIGDWVRMRMI